MLMTKYHTNAGNNIKKGSIEGDDYKVQFDCLKQTYKSEAVTLVLFIFLRALTDNAKLM